MTVVLPRWRRLRRNLQFCVVLTVLWQREDCVATMMMEDGKSELM